MIGRLNHVGVATPSIEESAALYRDVLGASKIHDKFKMEEQGVYVCFVDLQNSQIELIEPINDKSPIAGFLKNNPAGGQHHICFEVDDLHAARDEMVA
ncbi:MAG TPA: methylmalonyl-CoA epimerase, partial [Rhodobiaceae bacterium]|nr:methylmalonyl-CoA epimerase [Rhodobiaceae bacterium]